jgi:raffinose/stachyose/melibiose transport system substrate-binding protein
MQKYLAGEIDRAGLADEITTYWATAEVGEH